MINSFNNRRVVKFICIVVLFFPIITKAVKIGQGYFFACNSSNCSQTVTTGFQPKAILFYWTGQTAFGFAANADGGWGWTASTTASTPVQRSVAVSSTDASASSSNGRFRTESYSISVIRGTTLQREATTTFSTTGFSVNWRTPGATTAYVINYLAIGDDDIIASDAGTLTMTTSSGSQSYNSLSFQPDFLMFAWTSTETLDTPTTGMQIGMGMATSSSAQAAMVNEATNGVAANTNKRWQQSSTSTILTLTAVAAPAQDSIASLTSMNSNGFTINKVDPPAANTPVFFLAIKGGKHGVNFFDRPTSAQSQAITSVGFQPRSLFIMSALASSTDATTARIYSQGGMAIGAGTTTASSSAIWFQNFNVDSSDDNMSASSSKIALELSRSSTVTANAELTSLDSTGFTLNWRQILSTNQTRWFFWTIGDKAITPTVNSDSVFPDIISAVLNGTVSSTGGATITSRGFAWGTNPNLSGGDTSTTTESGSFGNASFSQFITNILSGKTYYYRAYATNSIGTSYGQILNFTTNTDNTPSRKIRLFDGYKLKVINNRLIITQQ